jgi:uncharacterized protein (DUF1810 family)
MSNDLERFVQAQKPVFDQAFQELVAGHKRSHWMWFIFPQLRGLGRSPTAQFYSIASLGEAEAYLAHPVLGQRLIRCTKAVLAHRGRSLEAIFGFPDHLKFRSSMTLFAAASGEAGSVFHQALETMCGEADAETTRLLQQPAPPA